MARIARAVAPGYPHHITQRGNRRQQTFFCEDDYLAYIELMAQWCRKYHVEIWAWCLMPNHVHLIAVPYIEGALSRAIGEAHRRYTRRINFREKWRGHLWQERFASFSMDEQYLLATARYIEMNPVAAKLVQNPEDYRWSSAKAHLSGEDDGLVQVSPLLELVSDWRSFLKLTPQDEIDMIHRHERTGRPLGAEGFIEKLELTLDRILRPKKPGPKKARS
ncbi:MAG: transposase [Desulfobulbaceae bacterium BRH_c16a]|nr:MAG: transposase [Desulfobulbaceae bacterium BRH_c16a]